MRVILQKLFKNYFLLLISFILYNKYPINPEIQINNGSFISIIIIINENEINFY